MPNVLFICDANRFRSPIAEALFLKVLRRQNIEKNWRVGSAGIWTQAGLPPVPSADWIHEHLGLDVSTHKSKPVSQELLTHYNLVLVMVNSQKEALLIEFPEMSGKLFMLTELSNGPVYDIPDPIYEPDETYLSVAQEINRLIEDCFQEICLRASRIQKNNR